MNIFRVSFIGHREVENYRIVEEKLNEILTELFQSKDFIEFQIGRNGEFDIFAASCIKALQRKFGRERSALSLILPYTVADIGDFEKYYDNIFIPPEAEKAHFKAAITKRNEWLVKNSELLIAYVHKESGGAAACLKPAEKEKLPIIRI